MRPKGRQPFTNLDQRLRTFSPKLLLSATCIFFFSFQSCTMCFISLLLVLLEGTRSRRQTPECAICYLIMVELPLVAGQHGRSIKMIRGRQMRIGAEFNCFRFRYSSVSQDFLIVLLDIRLNVRRMEASMLLPFTGNSPLVESSSTVHLLVHQLYYYRSQPPCHFLRL